MYSLGKTEKDTPQTPQEIWSAAPKLWSLRRMTSGSCDWSLQEEVVIHLSELSDGEKSKS